MYIITQGMLSQRLVTQGYGITPYVPPTVSDTVNWPLAQAASVNHDMTRTATRNHSQAQTGTVNIP